MAKFAKTNPDLKIVQTISAQLSWSHNTAFRFDKHKSIRDMALLMLQRVLFKKKCILVIIIAVKFPDMMGRVEFFNGKVIAEIFRSNEKHLGTETVAEAFHSGHLNFGGGCQGNLPHFFPVSRIFHDSSADRFYLVILTLLRFNRHKYLLNII